MTSWFDETGNKMADSDEWFVGEDGCLAVGKPVNNVAYHSTLNTILVATQEPSLQVIDVASGLLLQNSDLSGKSEYLECRYLPGKDKVFVTDGFAVGVRQDYHGILLLDTALQTPVKATEDKVRVELALPEASHLFKCLMSADLPGVDYVEDVLRELEKEIEAVQQATKTNHKVAKWATVCITQPHCALKTVCSSLVLELKRLHQHAPGLPVASAVADRMTYLLPSSAPSESSNGTVDRALMYSEGGRKETFSKWPHMNYKWALPDAMAQAGFYHQPSSTGYDRAMCFTCNVCLVCWEPTDEPWSEHERHSPTCPFVKGEYTQNVPVAVTYATQPAQLHSSKGLLEKIECVSQSCSEEFMATSTLHGNICVWNVACQLKKQLQFHVDPWDPVIALQTGTQLVQFSDLGLAAAPAQPPVLPAPPPPLPDKDMIDKEEPSQTTTESSEDSDPKLTEDSESPVDEFVEMGVLEDSSQDDASDDIKSKAEVIEVEGAWKQAKKDTVLELPLDEGLGKSDVFSRCRPSQDVLVSALSVITSQLNSDCEAAAAAAAPAPEQCVQPCLVAGVAIRRHTTAWADLPVTSDCGAGSVDSNGEVQALNQVNQALSEDATPHIIEGSSSGHPHSPFLPYLLLYDIASSRPVSKTKSSKAPSSSSADKPVGSGTSISSSGTKVSSLVSTVQDYYMPQIMEIEEEDYLPFGQSQSVSLPPPMQNFMDDDEGLDVQIVGVQPPTKPKMPISGPTWGSSMASPGSLLHKLKDSKHKEVKKDVSLPVRPGKKEGGQVLQCVSLPVSADHYVAHLLPTEASTHVVVVTQPKWMHPAITAAANNTPAPAWEADPSGSADTATAESDGGAILVYKVSCQHQLPAIQETPLVVHNMDSVSDAITSVLLLPRDVASAMDDEDNRSSPLEPSPSANEDGMVPDGQLAITTRTGQVKILGLSDLKCLATITPPDGDKFVSVTYCTGMERLCCSSAAGKLHFYTISPRRLSCMEAVEACEANASPSGVGAQREELMETNSSDTQNKPGAEELLADQSLSIEVLQKLHELTLFENLMPRFTATVPPCWTEIQQEQQQRRHPQHLQQQGEATQHTRTWRLQQDATSWDEHLFEIVLTKPVCLGHVDFKFSLHPLCSSPPNLQVTLLKQNISTLGRSLSSGSATTSQVDTPIDFPMSPMEEEEASPQPGSSTEPPKSWQNTALDPEFLKRYGAEVLCGPVSLEEYVDLSGHSGVITLTSPQLLKARARAYLVHVKAVPSTKEPALKEKSKSAAAVPPRSSSDKKDKASPLKAIWEPYSSATERLTSAVTKQKLDNLRGCDWLQEVSLTVRRCRKTDIPNSRQQRLALVEKSSLHEELMVVACGAEENVGSTCSLEHRQGLALQLLTWVASLQLAHPSHRTSSDSVMLIVQSNLKALVKACFINAGRSIAHRAAKLITICTEYANSLSICEPSSAPTFSFALLHALLANLSLVSCAYSAGALRWFFTLLNRVKVLDVGLTGVKCAELLNQVAKHYHERSNPLHSLLKARFGLYGSPLDPLLFDVDPPTSLKSSAAATSSQTTAASTASSQAPINSLFGVGSGTGSGFSNTTQAVGLGSSVATGTGALQALPGMDEVDFRDLMSLTSGDKTSSRLHANSLHRYMGGLLEVEPLHFTCHATSDGTRMERMDAGATHLSGGSSFGLSSNLQFGEPMTTPSAAGAALASLSTAMASAEQQLLLLQQKQAQLAKLQQKLAASGKLAGSGGTSPYMTGSAAGSAQSTPPSHTPHSQDFLPPPTPKTTPLFMTPPVTPPNESLLNYTQNTDTPDPGKPPLWKAGIGAYTVKVNNGKNGSGAGSKSSVSMSTTTHMLQCPPAQVLVIERMHSGARRFVVLDFGRCVLLTDILIPACTDLASLSIDTWVHGEEVDGKRLLVATDIGIRSLVMNDLMPPPVCRYLKITTIGRYGGSTTRSRIPIGSFYGHTTLLPWETGSSSAVGGLAPTELLTQLGSLLALQEDIQCRYSLACSRLHSLLAAVDAPNASGTHTRYYLRRVRRAAEDSHIHSAYTDCMALQLQLNLATHARERLQRALGLPGPQVPAGSGNGSTLLQQASTDKLRVLTELLLDCLLGMTVPTTSVPQLPAALHAAFPPAAATALFHHLCVHSPRRVQLSAGVLLTRLCGGHPWWGSFLGNVLQEYFSSANHQVFPQDRVFILLTVLGQKCLSGPRPSSLLEAILALLGQLLQPLQNITQEPPRHAGQLDLCLIGWVLLFLSRNLDATTPSLADETDRGASKDKDPGMGSSRWDFLQGDAGLWSSSGSSKASLSKMYRRKLHKRLLHHKHQLQDLQAAKKNFMAAQLEKSNAVALVMKDAEMILKQQEQIFKKELKQYSSKHIKDIMQIRRTDGELIKKLSKDNSSGSSGSMDREGVVLDGCEPALIVSREKCLPVVRGLVGLLLAMDFTCHVDLFLVACKVLARLSQLARPAICLYEALSHQELERLILLCCHLEYNHGNLSWGGAWAGHAITCLLQDLLDAEKMYANTASDSVTDDDITSFPESESAALSTDSFLSGEGSRNESSSSLATMDDEATGGEAEGGLPKLDKESSLLMDMLMEDEDAEDEGLKLQYYLQDSGGFKMPSFKGSVTSTTPATNVTVPVSSYLIDTYLAKKKSGAIPSPGFSFGHKLSGDDKQKKFESWKNKQLANYFTDKSVSSPQGVSTAMDARLETSIELAVELRLKVMVSMEADSVQTAFSAPLPIVPLVANSGSSQLGGEEEGLPSPGLATFTASQSTSSTEILSAVFNSLFTGLHSRRVNLESVLLMWLTLNDDTLTDEGGGQPMFDASRVPSIPLHASAVQAQLQALAWASTVSVQTWVLAFQSLTLLANVKPASSSEMSLASVMLADPNLITVLIKFLSGSSLSGTSMNGLQPVQVGPTATRAFHDLLVRLQLRVSDSSDSHFKELLLKLLYTLTSDKGAFASSLGPLDAQCKLVEYLLEQTYDTVDVNNALSVIECVSVLAHEQLASPHKLQCPNTSESTVPSRSCFGGLFSSVLRGSDSTSLVGVASRDTLLVSLLQLVEVLLQVRTGSPRGGRQASASLTDDQVMEQAQQQQPLTDASKISSMSQGGAAAASHADTPETDEQKTEHSATPQPRSCSHFTDIRHADFSRKEPTVADVVLTHPSVMRHLVEALSCCNSNTMAMILGSSGLPGTLQDSMAGNEPLSVGDAVFYVLCTINRLATNEHLLLRPLLDYLTCQGRALSIARLSEPLLWYLLRVLDCPRTISTFRQLGGVEILCDNLVLSNQRVINMSPSLVSTLMQYLGNVRMGSPLHKKTTADSDNLEDLQNFAPVGMISSSSPTAGPAEVLIQASPPHRRARSAAWSYHFYPDEAWVDLTVSLPCAIVLREVRIQPHLTSLATCPSAVSVEVSRDGLSAVPLCAPQPTSGLPHIKLQLLKPEVVTAVTLRLHKPRCLATIGLSQIMLLGNAAFRETNVSASSMFQPTEDYVSRTSIGWLRLLHHCLTQCESTSEEVASAAAPIPGLLATCTALLVQPSVQLLYATTLEAVLLRLGLHSLPMGLALIQHVLHTNTQPQQQGWLPLHGKMNGLANDSTVDIIYQLGTTQDAGTQSRVKALLEWLEGCAQSALEIPTADSSPYQMAPLSPQQPLPAPAHVHCVAAILWHSQELPVAYQLRAAVPSTLLSLLYQWSLTLPVQSNLKSAVDAVICSLCYVDPANLVQVLQWVGISTRLTDHTSLTDDVKDGQQHYSTQSLTDDSKEAASVAEEESHPLQLDEAHLQLVAAVCQSPHGLGRLLQTGFPAMLAQALYEYCSSEMMRQAEHTPAAAMVTDADKAATAGAANSQGASDRSTSSSGDVALVLSADMVAPVLRLLAALAQEWMMKDWLGSAEGSVFWPGLLSLLCHTLTPPTGPQQLQPTGTKVMTTQQRSAIETATVTFFTNVISCHSENQHLFANVLCEVIRSQASGTNSFCRRLFLQVLLEDERILVCFRSLSSLYKGPASSSCHQCWHPRCGAGHKARAAYIGLHCSASEVVGKISDLPTFKTPLLDGDQSDEHKSSEKDASQLGLEVVDQISTAAGLQAKEKREKSKNSASRPPSRRGHRPPEASGNNNVFIPCMDLYHKLLPGQPLPSELTMSQLLTLLHEHGLRPGQSILQLTVRSQCKKLASQRSPLDPIEEVGESIPDAVLLDTAPFPSALQVFASVGGLALLAEHLPLLYPEVTRQVTPPPTSEAHTGSGSGNDWVTVESSEDIYEDIYDQMPSQLNQSSKPSSSLVPSIPPHSLVAFGLFLRLPGYAEVLLKERRKAQCLLRLVLGVTDDGEGGHILTSSVASSLPTLPFHVLKTLFDGTPLRTDDGVLLRRMTLEIGAVHLVLACLSVLSHHAPRVPIPGFHQEIIAAATQAAVTLSTPSVAAPPKAVEEKGQNYWAKGTGFGTGSTTSSWDAEHALMRQRSEEEHVTCLLQVLSSYVNPGGAIPDDYETAAYHEGSADCKANLPAVLPELLCQSCLVPAISSYLRNDSVLDMARHVPLYRALLELLRALAVCPPLVSLLLPLDRDEEAASAVCNLLWKMKGCVDTYANRLKSNKNKGSSGGSKTKQEEEESEGLALLIPDIQETARIVHIATSRCPQNSPDTDQSDGPGSSDTAGLAQSDHSQEQRYMSNMQELQFDTYEMVVEEDMSLKFRLSHHYESSVKAAGDSTNPARARRLAQEAVTLSTSLPLSYSSSVFVRCDEERLDIMKVLITGPSDTPYANGCFEFDVYFPQDYPNSPPLINLETTGNHTVRFNPNLYNDGKVCLSILNTWHGRPEEKWNSQTSSFLQVLVSIQSLILVNEPYFNEPGYERSRGTPSGNASSREYDANIRQATVKWAMLEQLRNPSPCFKEVVRRHFYLKRSEICEQVEGWLAEMEACSGSKRMGRTISQSAVAIKRYYNQLKEELWRMRAPDGLEGLEGATDEDSQGASGVSPLPCSSGPLDSSEKGDRDTSSEEDSTTEAKEAALYGGKLGAPVLGLAGGLGYQDKPTLLECMGNGEIESDEEFQSVEC